MPDPEAERARPANPVMLEKATLVVEFVVEMNGEGGGGDGDGERTGVVVVVPWKGAVEDKQPET